MTKFWYELGTCRDWPTENSFSTGCIAAKKLRSVAKQNKTTKNSETETQFLSRAKWNQKDFLMKLGLCLIVIADTRAEAQN